VSDLTGFDSAYPPSNPPPDQVVFGYLGGDTPHVWTPAEWAAQKARYRVGIWTRSNPVGAAQGKSEGEAAVAAWRALGAPAGTLLVLDYETAINSAYLTAFDDAAVAGGCKVAVYGSTSTVYRNPKPSGGYFPADITNTPHLVPGTLITQYEFESGWDDDEVAAGATSMLWDTQPAQGGSTMSAIQWSDDINGIGGRKGGNRVDYILTDISRLRDALFGDTTVQVPAGSPLANLLAFLKGATGELAEVQQIVGSVEKLSAPTVDAAALATAIAGDAAFIDAIANAFVAKIGSDLKG
jgi:hypothetical protein